MPSGPSEDSSQHSPHRVTQTTPNTSFQYGHQDDTDRAPRFPPDERRESFRLVRDSEQSRAHNAHNNASAETGNPVTETSQQLRSSKSIDSETSDSYATTHSSQDGAREAILESQGQNATTEVKQASYAFAQLPNEVLIQIVSHLPPQSLSNVALVSRRFQDLVNSPHAWRIAFCRIFPGADSLRVGARHRDAVTSQDAGDAGSGKRSFTRLTAFSTWRSEYILRTRLLRCLARGKPATAPKSSGASGSTRSTLERGGRAAVTYSSGLHTTITHIHASFPPVQHKKLPRFIVGADDNGCARRTNAAGPRIELWGTSDPQSFLQFEQRSLGESMWGLGEGNLVGLPNVMDLSQPFGMVHGEGSPGGLVYLRSTEEKRGRFLAFSAEVSVPELGVPKVPGTTEAMCSVWIAKSMNIPMMTDGLVGILCGSSSGVVTAYSLGTHGVEGQRLARGELTARWVVSPGVPIIAIAVDDSFSAARMATNRIWMAVLNALGEVFYLSDIPRRSSSPPGTKPSVQELELLGWETGRTVCWKLITPSKRAARPDPFKESQLDASYSPTSPWNGMGFDKNALVAHTQEMERFMAYKPKHFRTVCMGWDMRRRFEVDFAGNDPEMSQSFVVIKCGVETDEPAQIERYSLSPKASSLTSRDTHKDGKQPTGTSETHEWRTSELSLGLLKDAELTTTCIDHSHCALSTAAEDPLLDESIFPDNASGGPAPSLSHHQLLSAIPGQRARLMAAGTKSGSIVLWDLRAPISSNPGITNTILPVRIISTDSPQITSLALTALYVVHGGSDCLVQAWDPLGSSTQPIRTLNSRFRTRARRRLIQAEGGGGALDLNGNVYPAAAICLDPDPTVLRGMVSLGPHLRYWSYSSSGADQFAGRSRRLRRGPRRSNHAAGGSSHSDFGRSSLEDYIASETREFAHDEKRRQKEAGRLAGRFGVGMLGAGAGEEELAYALMLSEESFMQDEEKRRSGSDISSPRGSISSSVSSSQTITPEGSIAIRASSPPVSVFHEDDDIGSGMDDDLAEALRRSLLDDSDPTSSSIIGESSAGASNIPIRYAAKSKSKRSASYSSSTSSPPTASTKGITIADGGLSSGLDEASELDDLDFALQLSLAEERSRRITSGSSATSTTLAGDSAPSSSAMHMNAIPEEEFPALASSVSPPGTGYLSAKKNKKKKSSASTPKSGHGQEKAKEKGKQKSVGDRSEKESSTSA